MSSKFLVQRNWKRKTRGQLPIQFRLEMATELAVVVVVLALESHCNWCGSLLLGVSGSRERTRSSVLFKAASHR